MSVSLILRLGETDPMTDPSTTVPRYTRTCVSLVIDGAFCGLQPTTVVKNGCRIVLKYIVLARGPAPFQ